MTRVSAFAAAGIAILALPLTPSMAAAADTAPGASVAAVSKHTVDLLWKPDQQDIASGAIILDTFDSFGPPFGNDKPLETLTPRNQIGSDQRSGKWRVAVRPGKNPGLCSGTFEIEKNVLETTPTSQTVQYAGTLRLKRCKGVAKFKDVRPGKLGNLQGETICTANGCRGGLEIVGSLRY